MVIFTRKTFLIFVAALTAVSTANANLILTLNGSDTSDFPLIIWNVGDLLVAVAGSTQIEPNDVSVSAVGGVLEPVPDANHQYYFEFYAQSNEATISLVTNVDMVIDGNSIPAGTTIYELSLFYNRQYNILAAAGIGLEDLLPPDQGAGAQESGMMEELLSPAETPTLAVTESTVAEEKSTSYKFVSVTPYSEQKQQEKLKSLKYCPPAEFPETKGELLRAEKDINGEIMPGGCYGSGMLLDGNVVTVDSDITSNTVWTSDNTYHVLADINVQALLVIEPGTTIYFSYDNYAAMFINNGGTLISCGTPDNPVIYTSDSEYPDYDDYYCPIYIEETASSLTKVTYSYIEWAYAGVVVLDRRLEANIENNYFVNCVFGIVEYGLDHTDISNNLFYGSGYGAIEVNMTSLSGEASSDSQIYIQNNTCDYSPQWDGISVYGVPNLDDAGFVLLRNNLVSNNGRYGLVLANGYMYASVLNTGYYGNAYNKNGDFGEENPVIATQWPYEDGAGVMPWFYLKQDCPFIDAGYEYIEQTHLIGKTTDTDSPPDCNKTDIGFHYPNWHFSNAGNVTDLNGDLIVNFKDFAILANSWQTTYHVNDLATMAGEWLQSEPNIEINIYGDSNQGYVDVGISGFTSNTQRVFLLADGKYVGEIFGFANSDTLGMDISESGGQEQQLKAISINNNGQVTCSNITDAAFSCPLNYCLLPSSYEPNKPCYFAAFNPAAGNVSVNVYADGGNLVWSQTYSGNSIFGSIPAEITRQYEIDYVSFGGASIIKGTEPALHLWGTPSDLAALIILPEPVWGKFRLSNMGLTEAVQDAFKQAGVKYKKLGSWSATFKNIKQLAENRPIRYIYFDGHGWHHLENDDANLRTCVKLWDGWTVSVKQSDFPPGQAPPWCQKLGGNRENTTKSFFKMGFNDLEFVYFNCCNGGKLKINANDQLVIGQEGKYGVLDGPYSDMSLALGMHISNPDKNRVYQSWFDNVSTGDVSKFNKWGKDQWGKLGEGETLGVAISYAYGRSSEDGETGRDPREDYRLKGRGDPTVVILH